jgi:hypothetical protein
VRVPEGVSADTAETGLFVLTKGRAPLLSAGEGVVYAHAECSPTTSASAITDPFLPNYMKRAMHVLRRAVHFLWRRALAMNRVGATGAKLLQLLCWKLVHEYDLNQWRWLSLFDCIYIIWSGIQLIA